METVRLQTQLEPARVATRRTRPRDSVFVVLSALSTRRAGREIPDPFTPENYSNQTTEYLNSLLTYECLRALTMGLDRCKPELLCSTRTSITMMTSRRIRCHDGGL